MNYLTKDDIIAINKRFTGHGTIINDGALTSATTNPSLIFGGHEACPTIEEKIFALVCPLSKNHPFEDGNKRTATAAAKLFLERNEKRVIPDKDATFIELISSLADVAEDDDDEKENFISQISTCIEDV